ncbi:MAG: OmpA family protein [Runella slithyformis]|nr:MAG: OmpA family protein [Runella slithyformis]TAF27105.1 MAG: OmpA family protein [Runella slithyformis]TAF45530.1 MAG: OmpA family protein [Runella slithyformis]TAF80286.1 MAG: OmpA family protein [Runella slithyformis]
MKTWILVLILLVITCPNAPAQCLPVAISVADYTTQKPLQTQLFVRLYGQRKPLGNSNEAGRLVVSLPCSATELIVEKQGYRPLSLPLTIGQQSAIELPYSLPLALMPLDQQAIDRPYSQSEQKEYVLKSQKQAEKATEFRLFKITDAITSASIVAEVCLFYTKTRQKNCFTSGNTPTEIPFEQPDIVAIEVKAEGYQRYQGNLILETFEGKRRVYEIKLSKQLSIFTAYIKSDQPPKQVQLYDAVTGQTLEMKPAGLGQFTATVEASRTYQWRVLGNKNQVLYDENLIFLAGLNQRAVAVKQAKQTQTPPPLATTPTEKPLFGNTTPVVYFEQSTYELSPQVRLQLENWASWWRQNTKQKIRIEGHTDNVGDARLNQLLSENRAKVVATYLFNQGVADSCVLFRGFGPHRPTAANDTEESRKKNRRVEISSLPL